MELNFTKAQQSAIDTKGKTLLVSAAAGSGKTFTLTQRIIKSIREGDGDLSRMLIVTFTRAAAADMKAKISKALAEALAEQPDNDKLQEQMLKLGGAHISTIDSFFSEPVRQNFEKLNLPASMRLCDEAELSPIQETVMSSVLEMFYEKYCNIQDDSIVSEVTLSNCFTSLVGIISGARDNSKLVPTLIDIYKKLITSPLGVYRLQEHAERAKKSAGLDFFQTDEGKILLNDASSIVFHSIMLLGDSIEKMECDELLSPKYIPCFAKDMEACLVLIKALSRGYDESKQAFESFAPSRIPSIKSDQKTEESESFRELRSEKINKPIKNLAKTHFAHEQAQISIAYEKTAEICKLMCDILCEYERQYSNEKLRRGICEFSDMPKFMLKLLIDEHGNETEYAASLKSRYDEVYIDEYQDVNEIQDRIFSIIGGNHRFMVGDIKQSIYGFRDAEPSIFAGYRKSFTPLEDSTETDESEQGCTIFMSENFRCDQNVIDFTNLVCARVFSAFCESIGYTSEDDLRFAKKLPSPEYTSPTVQINIIEKIKDNESDEPEEDEALAENDDESADGLGANLYDEAVVTANEIARLIREEKRADGKKIRGGDITVLMRSTAPSNTAQLTRALDKLGIKYSLSQGSSIFESSSLKILVDLLTVINNPTIDIPLCRLLSEKAELYSPKFTLEEIVRIRKHTSGAKSLYDAVISYEGEGTDGEIVNKCKEFVSLVEKLRNMSIRLSVDKLLRAIALCEEFSALCESESYTYLYDSACKYSKNATSSLYSFLIYFKKLMEKGCSAEDKANDGDTVTIMTIHHSKGLEFNTCFIYGCGKDFNLSDSKSPIIFSKELGLSLKLPPNDDESGVFEKISQRYSDNPLWKSADVYTKKLQIEEEARVFYVALTRARERLYISATIRKDFESYSSPLYISPDKSYEIINSKSYLKWILLAIGADEGENKSYSINVFQKGKCKLGARIAANDLIEGAIADFDESERRLSKILSSKPKSQSYEEQLLSSIPAKIAASKASDDMLDKSVFIAYPANQIFSTDEDIGDDGGILKNENAENIKNRIELMRSQATDFDSLLEVNKKPTAAEIGTATHQFLQFCDYKNVEKNGIENEVSRLLKNKFITKRTASIIDLKQLKSFFEGKIYAEIKTAKNIRREFKFGLFRSASDFTSDEQLSKLVSDKKIFVQGSIDLIIESRDGKILLCDYKTDRISYAERQNPELLLSNMREKHASQMQQYKYAISQIFGKAPDKIYIYSLSLCDAIELE